MTIHIRKDGPFRSVSGIHLKVSGSWKIVAEGYVKVNGSWKEFYRIPPAAPVISGVVDVGTNRAFNNAQFVVSFALPTGSQAATQGYTITASASGQASVVVDSNSSPATLSGLISNVTYDVKVVAKNNYGTSADSSIVSKKATTVPQTIGKPGVTTAVDQDTISWVTPPSGGKDITTYRWESTDNKTGIAASSPTNIIQEGSTSQSYRVRAENENGVGEWSAYSDSITTTPPYFPYFPYFPPYFPPFFPFFPYFPYFPPYFPPFFPYFPYFPPYFRAGCIGAETLIRTANGLVAAKDIKVGDKVLSYKIEEKPQSEDSNVFMWNSTSITLSKDVSETEIVRVVEKKDSAVMFFNGNSDVKYSITQPVFIKSGNEYKIRTTGSLELGDLIIGVDINGNIIEEEIIDITIEDKLETVYQIDAEPLQWFIAGDYLVHNK